MSGSRDKQRTAAVQRLNNRGINSPSEKEIKREMKQPGSVSANSGGTATATLRR